MEEESMQGAEMFDIFNSEMIRIGTESRTNVHANGLWHQTFHCWIVNNHQGERKLLFQMRHKDKDTYPGLLDISCAGHLQSGETVEDGVRELQEELGISISIEELIYCGMVAEEHIISEECIDREYNYIFVLESIKALEEYEFQKSEISGLFYINISEFKELLCGEIDFIETEGVVIDGGSQSVSTVTRKFWGHDFTPKSMKYYQVLFGIIEIVWG